MCYRKDRVGREKKNKSKEPKRKCLKDPPPPTKLYFLDIQQFHISFDEREYVAPGGISHLWYSHFMEGGYCMMAHVIICEDGGCISMCAVVSDLLDNSPPDIFFSSVLANKNE